MTNGKIFFVICPEEYLCLIKRITEVVVFHLIGNGSFGDGFNVEQ